ncbi:MAG: hypothetical protein A2138_06450 [Deltaproteobacteria bacterium RBG_16_71_12]|nr:MAG: hypothetical protein A2138_06450 [Deltaproteobacteria bacterium RBG_16_71_12]
MSAPRGAALAHYDELARLGKALSSPIRLRLLDLLRQGPRSVEVLAGRAGVTVANASQHLQQLRAGRLVEADKRGQQVVYRLASRAVSSFFSELRALAEAQLPEMDRLRRELRVAGPAERAALLARVRAGAVTLLDVRPAEEFLAGHLRGALSVPLAELRARLPELPKGREVVAYCRGPYCHLALEAVRVLEDAGFRAQHLDLGPPDLEADDLSGDVDALPPRVAPRSAPGRKR